MGQRLEALALAWALGACGPGVEPVSSGPCLTQAYRPVTGGGARDAVDLLVVIDDSPRAADEQRRLSANFARLLDRLIRAADLDGNGRAERASLSDLHVGIVSMDVGSGGFAVAGCDDAVDGDDGILLSAPRAGAPACAAQYPAYLSWHEGDDPEHFGEDFSCVANLGEVGCSVRQPFAAVWRALTVHRTDTNAGFLRDDSLLVVLFVTDGDDCSIRQDQPTDLFDEQSDLGPFGVRCALHADTHLEPAERFAQNLLALRGARHERLVVAALVGVPPDTACATDDSGPAGFDCVLAEPAMQERVDESSKGRGERLVPSCAEPPEDPADPPRRIVSLLRAVSEAGGATLLRSSCAPSFEEAADAIAATIGARLQRTDCLTRPLPLDETGIPACFIEEEPIEDGPCPPGRADVGEGIWGRRCRICRSGDGDQRLFDVDGVSLAACAGATEAGDTWQYVRGSECPQTGRIDFRGATAPRPGSSVSLQCLVSDC